jgi:hypothetical protein
LYLGKTARCLAPNFFLNLPEITLFAAQPFDNDRSLRL